ncbi:MAG: hypothetical protein C5617_002120 [ANME-2 cluster archaeon]|nr:MAG: hypothetical protein C5617_002120 [ANME-2 cluster archaeon]
MHFSSTLPLDVSAICFFLSAGAISTTCNPASFADWRETVLSDAPMRPATAVSVVGSCFRTSSSICHAARSSVRAMCGSSISESSRSMSLQFVVYLIRDAVLHLHPAPPSIM